MVVIASITIIIPLPWTSVIILMGSTLLDLVDGKVARAYNQCTIFGSGIDWIADIMTQVVIQVWICMLEPRFSPIFSIITTIEVSNCVYDFAQTAKVQYPPLIHKSGFFIINDWFISKDNANTNLNVFCWLAYPIWALAFCLDYSIVDKYDSTTYLLKFCQLGLIIPSFLYAWSELAWCCHILAHWSEPRKDLSKIDD